MCIAHGSRHTSDGFLYFLHEVFGDLRRVLVEREALQPSRTFSCVQHFLQENSTHLCSYLVSSFVLSSGQGTRKEIYQINLPRILYFVFYFLLVW